MERMAQYGEVVHVDARVEVSARRVLKKGILILGVKRFASNLHHLARGKIKTLSKYDDIRQ